MPGMWPLGHTAHPWLYFVPHQADVTAALQQLRQQEFRAGRWFDGTTGPFPNFAADQPPKADSADDALEMMFEVGTRSILDMVGVSQRRRVAYVAPVADQQLLRVFGTTQPTHEQVEQQGGLVSGGGLFDRFPTGCGMYFTVYRDGAPAELCFFGYSYE